MLRITIELVPWGIEDKKRTIGIAEIYNDGTGTSTTGNYGVRVFKRGSNGVIWKTGKVWGFPRKKLLAWDLLYRALHNIIGERNKESKNGEQRFNESSTKTPRLRP